MDGVINFLKPARMSSHDAVGFFRRLTGIKKIGHTGTLDPMAVGVLPICIGRATRVIEYINGKKSYRAISTLGMTSETQDIWGEKIVKSTWNKSPSFQSIQEGLKKFEGRIVQKVPAYSALKHDGKKLYDYARAGQPVPDKNKKVNIYSIDLIDYNSDQLKITFDVDCSQGTYIRTICADFGHELGYGGLMSFLLRTSSNGLDITDSVTLEELEEEKNQVNSINKFLIDPDSLLTHMEKITLGKEDSNRFVHGLERNIQMKDQGLYRIYDHNDNFIGLGEIIGNFLKPKKVIELEKR